MNPPAVACRHPKVGGRPTWRPPLMQRGCACALGAEGDSLPAGSERAFGPNQAFVLTSKKVGTEGRNTALNVVPPAPPDFRSRPCCEAARGGGRQRPPGRRPAEGVRRHWGLAVHICRLRVRTCVCARGSISIPRRCRRQLRRHLTQNLKIDLYRNLARPVSAVVRIRACRHDTMGHSMMRYVHLGIPSSIYAATNTETSLLLFLVWFIFCCVVFMLFVLLWLVVLRLLRRQVRLLQRPRRHPSWKVPAGVAPVPVCSGKRRERRAFVCLVCVCLHVLVCIVVLFV